MFDEKNPYKLISLKKADSAIRKIQSQVIARSPVQKRINSFWPRYTPRKTVREDGIVFVNDVRYDDEYPNSFFDVWYREDLINCPVVFYFHGGGFMMGSKNAGDPLAMKSAQSLSFIGKLLEIGCCVVNVDYALAPKYRCPVQIEQANRAIAYALSRAEEFHIDADRIFLMGGSAGADISEIYGLMLVNTRYAKNYVKDKLAIASEQVCCLIIEEAALQTKTFMDERMNAMFESWTGEDNYKEAFYMNILDVPKFIEDKFPPSYIISSNVEHFFPDHGEELCAVLDRIGAEYEYFYPDRTRGEFDHGFLMGFNENEVAREGFERMLAFIRRQAGL